jgi:uncharacterized protein GlcG (DUF336 family)
MGLLTMDCANALMGQAREKTHSDYGRPISIAICDAGGFLMAFSRGDGAPIRTIQIALGKAYTASRMGSSTEAFLARLRNEDLEISHFCDPLLTALPGGALLKDGQGQVLGAVGVSGLAPQEDQSTADFAAELFRQGLVT